MLPALNEEKTVGDVIRAIPPSIPGVSAVSVVVVDDGSTDGTPRAAREAGAQVISFGRHRGLGAAFRAGIKHAMSLNADLLVTIDADGQFDPAHIPGLIRPIVQGEADFVTATRFADPARVPDMPRVKLAGNRFMTGLINFLTRGNCQLTDVSCGFRAYSKEALLRLNLFGGYTYTQEVILSLAHSEARLAEVSVAVRGQRSHGRSRIAHNLFVYGMQTLKIILRTYRDYRPLPFFFGAGLLCFIPGSGLALLVTVHYMVHHRITPHKWAAVGAGVFFLSALLLAVTGIMADMNSRLRLSLEELLVSKRRAEMEQSQPKPR